jgi:hypothetical protein
MPSASTLRRTTVLTAVAATALVGVAACGSSTGSTGAASTTKQSPSQALHTGYDGLSASSALTFTLKLDATKAQFEALNKADGDAPGDASDAEAETAVLGGSVVLATKTSDKSFGAAASDPKEMADTAFGVAVNAGDSPDLVQLAYVGPNLFARANVSKLASYSPGGQAEVQQFASSGTAAKYPFVTAAVNGGWLKLNLPDVLSFANGVAPGKVPTVTPSQIIGLQAALSKVFTSDLTVTRTAADPTLGDHLVLTGDTAKVGADLVTALKSSLASLPGASSLFAKANTAELASKQVSVDTYVNSGAIDAVKLNLTQFFSPAEKAAVANAPVDLELDIARSASVPAPASATTVTTAQIIGLFEAISGESASASGTSFVRRTS